jgi:3-methylcrotonyl-CoA carboxylase alpha subunit
MLAEALGETIVAGPKTNAAFLKRLCEADGFRAGQFDTGFIDRNLESLGVGPQPPDDIAVSFGAAALISREIDRLRMLELQKSDEPSSPWSMPDGFQLLGTRSVGVSLLVDGERAEAREVFSREHQGASTVAFGNSDPWADEQIDREIEAPHGVYVFRNGRQTLVQPYDPFDVDLEHMDEGGSVKAPMHGKLIAVFVQPGERVEKGQRLAIVEAMKMEHVLVAPSDAEIAEIAAEPGAQVAEGARLIVLKTKE